MLPYYKYHPESGTILCRIIVVNEGDLRHYTDNGYEFIPAKDNLEMELWVDPLTKEFHPTIPYKLPSTISAVIGEDVEITVPKPAWIQLSNTLPVKCDTGNFTVPYNGDNRNYLQLVGSYSSTPIQINWKSLIEVKTEAKNRVDEEAEANREALQTAGAGQATTYLRKADAARDYLAGKELSEAQLSRLQDEAIRMEMDLEAVALLIIQKAEEWEARDAEIDRIRLEAKSAIDSANTGKEINEILENLNWN